MQEALLEKRKMIQRGLEKRASLEQALAEELQLQRLKTGQLKRDMVGIEAFSLRLKYHERQVLAAQHKLHVLEIYDKWVDGTAGLVCVGDSEPLRDDTVGGYRGHGGKKLTPQEEALEVGMAPEEKADRRHAAAKKVLSELKRGLGCVPANRPPRVMEPAFNWSPPPTTSKGGSGSGGGGSDGYRVASESEATAVARIEAVRVVEGSAAGTSVGTWLERERVRQKKPLSQRYATRQQVGSCGCLCVFVFYWCLLTSSRIWGWGCYLFVLLV
jgi:hypothetical protein